MPYAVLARSSLSRVSFSRVSFSGLPVPCGVYWDPTLGSATLVSVHLRWCPRRHAMAPIWIRGGHNCGRSFTTATGAASTSTSWLAVSIGRAQRAFHNGGVIVRWKGKINKTKKVLQDFRIALYTGLPVLVNASLEMCLSVCQLLGMRWSVVVIPCVGINGIKMLRVSCFPPIGELSKVFEYVVLCMSSYPGAIRAWSERVLTQM